MAAPTITSRFFLVGCPRSGTTLLQCLLAANSQLVSYPETHFFERMIRGRKIVRALGLAPRRARRYWKMFLEDINHPELRSYVPWYAMFVSQYSRAYLRILDGLCLQQGRTMWLEKTPGHLRRIQPIQRLVPNARFVHIVRNGADTIASMYHVAGEYSASWAPWYGTLDQCIDRWLRDVQISLDCVGLPGHKIIIYEELLQDPEGVLAGLCEFAGIPFEESMLTEYAKQADTLVHEGERWKNSVRQPIWRQQPPRFYEYLNDDEREHVLNRIPVSLSGYFRPDGDK